MSRIIYLAINKFLGDGLAKFDFDEDNVIVTELRSLDMNRNVQFRRFVIKRVENISCICISYLKFQN